MNYYKNIENRFNEEGFVSIETFKKFINWVAGEFDLYQQEELNGLIVFFPNGYFNIEELETKNFQVKYRVIIESKSEKRRYEINNQLKSILHHIQNFNNI